MNPLFNSLFGAKQGPAAVQQQQTGMNQGNDWNAMMGQLRANPAEMVRGAGYQVPDEIAGNPQATVMHLIRSGQVAGPVMQRIQPMLNMLGVR